MERIEYEHAGFTTDFSLDSHPLLQGIRRGHAPYEALYHTFNKSVRLRIYELPDLEKRG